MLEEGGRKENTRRLLSFRGLYSLLGSAVAGYHGSGGLINSNFSQFCRLAVQDQGVGRFV